jgi:hypothetical protein
MNAVHVLTAFIFHIHFNIISHLHAVSQAVSCIPVSDQICMTLYLLDPRYTSHQTHPPLFHYHNKI